MLCKALREFPFSRDGFSTIQAEAGETVDIPDEHVPGLAAEGYVEVLAVARGRRAPGGDPVAEPKPAAPATPPVGRRGRPAKGVDAD